MVAAVLMIGVAVGVVSVRDQVVQEWGDVAATVLDTSQTYSFSGASSQNAQTAGSDFEDMSDAWSPIEFSAVRVEGGGGGGGSGGGGGGEGGGGEPRTQGFWKNHPVDWPVDSLTLGNQTYSKQELLDLLNTPSQGDASVILARQLIAAKLNVANGVDGSSVADAISTADSLLGSQGPGKLPYQIDTNSSTGQDMTEVKDRLDAFNNGN